MKPDLTLENSNTEIKYLWHAVKELREICSNLLELQGYDAQSWEQPIPRDIGTIGPRGLQD